MQHDGEEKDSWVPASLERTFRLAATGLSLANYQFNEAYCRYSVFGLPTVLEHKSG